jgi:Zn-dependent protease
MIDFLTIFPVLLFSVVIHELAHGLMALKLGDPTAKQMGRLTLNPIPHIDLVGSILVPLISLLVAGRVFIAWAKPVPVNPANFSNLRRDDILVSVVGPLSNVVLACLLTLVIIILSTLVGSMEVLQSERVLEVMNFLLKMLYMGIYLNILLAVFNMLPIPPLDGSHVLASLLPDRLSMMFRRVGFFGIVAILFLLQVPAFRTVFFSVIDAIFSPLHALMEPFITHSE